MTATPSETSIAQEKGTQEEEEIFSQKTKERGTMTIDATRTFLQMQCKKSSDGAMQWRCDVCSYSRTTGSYSYCSSSPCLTISKWIPFSLWVCGGGSLPLPLLSHSLSTSGMRGEKKKPGRAREEDKGCRAARITRRRRIATTGRLVRGCDRCVGRARFTGSM
jgi:hypothetical protein